MRTSYSERPVNCPKCGGELKDPQWRMFGPGDRARARASVAYARANDFPQVLVAIDEMEAARPDEQWLEWRCDCGFGLTTATKDADSGPEKVRKLK